MWIFKYMNNVFSGLKKFSFILFLLGSIFELFLELKNIVDMCIIGLLLTNRCRIWLDWMHLVLIYQSIDFGWCFGISFGLKTYIQGKLRCILTFFEMVMCCIFVYLYFLKCLGLRVPLRSNKSIFGGTVVFWRVIVI